MANLSFFCRRRRPRWAAKCGLLLWSEPLKNSSGQAGGDGCEPLRQSQPLEAPCCFPWQRLKPGETPRSIRPAFNKPRLLAGHHTAAPPPTPAVRLPWAADTVCARRHQQLCLRALNESSVWVSRADVLPPFFLWRSDKVKIFFATVFYVDADCLRRLFFTWAIFLGLIFFHRFFYLIIEKRD